MIEKKDCVLQQMYYIHAEYYDIPSQCMINESVNDVLDLDPDQEAMKDTNPDAHVVSEDELIEGLGRFVAAMRMQHKEVNIAALNFTILRARIQGVVCAGDTAEQKMDVSRILMSMYHVLPPEDLLSMYGIMVKEDPTYLRNR
jgi:hypothetical protein